MNSRSPGRYNLHRLGWTAFEDLCMQVMRVVLGETCTRFRMGADGGRDGWFQGVASGRLATEVSLSGHFIVQCKHTSKTNESLSDADLDKEFEKVALFRSRTPSHYILMTNRSVSGPNEAAIRARFESTHRGERCLVLNETWIEDTIDAHPRLLRLVPRLYGIGDLSQILSFNIAQQTSALLEDLARALRTFVPTDSYRRAERALHDHGFVVLVGPPASGKSAIAANLCMVNLAQDPDVRVMRIEQADQFKDTWSPSDAHAIYWVDDVFGETTLDDVRLREWSAALDKVEAARRRGARIIFCTRDYILNAASRKLKKNRADFVNDARVRVDVTELSITEREAIMYNHIKDGDITPEQKRKLKRHLSSLARQAAFSPELARRLGSKRFHVGLKYEYDELQAFFEKPVPHFRDVIHGLSTDETAALALCLMTGNAVPDPVPDESISQVVLSTYGTTPQQVRQALELLEGSLVKRMRQATKQTWQVHHPSMIEALQTELATKSSQLVLYLQGAVLPAILRDTTTVPSGDDARLVFLPETVYPLLVPRLLSVDARALDTVTVYLVDRASDSLLRLIDATDAAFLDRALASEPEPDGPDASPFLAVRLSRIRPQSLLTAHRREAAAQALTDSVSFYGWTGFLNVEGLNEALPGFVEEFLAAEVRNEFPSMGKLYDWHATDLSQTEHVEAAIDAVQSNETWLLSALADLNLLTDDLKNDVTSLREYLQERLQDRLVELEEVEQRRADASEDDWKERWHEERYELENGRFADVDE